MGDIVAASLLFAQMPVFLPGPRDIFDFACADHSGLRQQDKQQSVLHIRGKRHQHIDSGRLRLQNQDDGRQALF